jgi:hypothetical protein
MQMQADLLHDQVLRTRALSGTAYVRLRPLNSASLTATQFVKVY